MRQQPPPSNDSGGGFQASAGWAYLLCRALSITIEVFAHESGSFGERYLGIPAAFAALVIVLWTGFCVNVKDADAMIGFLLVYLFMVAVCRARVQLRLRKGGPVEHSFYTGRPWIMRFLGRLDEMRVKSVIEPLLAFAAAALATKYVSVALGGYLTLASFALLISMRLSMQIERTQALDYQDALIDSRRRAERLRHPRHH
ncbi:MAG: hypothetical protein ACREJD_08445 [Phycisphaerales bacterium]